MEKLTNVKEKLKGLNYKVYSLHMIEPKFEDLTEGSLVCKEHGIEFIYLNKDKIITVLKLKYDDITNIEIDNILVNIFMSGGKVYHLNQLRQNLDEILADFNNEYLTIEDEQAIHILKDYRILKNNNILKITGVEMDENNMSKSIQYKVNLDDVNNIMEDYWGQEDGFREVFITANGKNMAIWCN
ncbi:hypothetical protein KM800_02905 [Clostridium tyrobutyricum]|uniref:hypothetical protein n=1 Tax=Clostridium tyrobutyricum TaxID=1519 RepID=UPI0010AA197A|nr:hypothetical protein [Clostridium tyrobutyricum]MBV4418283.1 hypothetical protein [Clostridium tyrobutyricum]QCH27622.1 hypothetical protein EZN00_01220 [Clostridium tyrobutyricum]